MPPARSDPPGSQTAAAANSLGSSAADFAGGPKPAQALVGTTPRCHVRSRFSFRADIIPLPNATLPAITLHVGVSGHRALPDANRAALAAAATTFFHDARARVEAHLAEDQAAPHPLYRSADPVLRCLCGIAEGADTIFAEAALAQRWELAAILPFAPDEFANDFEGEALARYRALLGRARIVVALEGARTPDATPYAAVGDAIVDQSDALLVIWDGRPPRGPGGTGDVVAAGRRRDLPIAILPPTAPINLRWDPPRTDPATALRRLLRPDPARTAARERFSTASSRQDT